MEISNDIMLGLIAVMMAVTKIVEKLIAKIVNKKNGNDGSAERKLMHDIIDTLEEQGRQIESIEKTVGEEGGLRKHIEVNGNKLDAVQKIAEFNERTLKDVWDRIMKFRTKSG